MEYKYFIFLNRDAQLISRYGMFRCGYANGYVAIPPTNKFAGKDYYEIEDIDVHGGLTYGKSISETKGFGWTSVECIGFDSLDEIPNDYFVFGFDTLHFGDDETLDREYCIEEAEKLMQQLREKGRCQ